MALARTLLLPALAAATSFKMDFLSSGTVRTDPLAFSQARCTYVDCILLTCTTQSVPFLPTVYSVECKSLTFKPLCRQTGECLSDHVHRFYGAVSDRTMRPEVSFEDLRAAPGNTGNVEENKSLYWNPAIYKADLYAMFDDTRTKRLLATTLQTLSNTVEHRLHV